MFRGLGFRIMGDPDPQINEPPPLSRDYNRDPTVKALARNGSINHGPRYLEVRLRANSSLYA